MPGELMAAEMAEQPQVLERLLGRRRRLVDEMRAGLPDQLHGVALAARGSSDNAAIVGRYMLELATRRPVSLVAPSLLSLYGADISYRGQVAVAISQSGETPEIVSVLDRMQRSGARGVAITNRPDSPLAAVADLVVDLGAGEERAVPATKTFTAQLAAFGMLAEALGDPPWTGADWEGVPAAVEEVLADPQPAREAAFAIGDAEGIICVGRGSSSGSPWRPPSS